MKDFLLKLAPVWRLKPLGLLTLLTGQKLVMPFYHAVEDEPQPYLKHAYPVKSVKSFEKDLDELLHHFEPIDTETLINWAQTGKQPSKRSFWLSFDDGLSSFYHFAAPVLKRKGIPAACFVNTAFIDNKDLFFRYKASLVIEQINGLENVVIKKIAGKLEVETDFQVIKERIESVKYAEKRLLDDVAEIAGISFSEFLKTEQPYLSTAQIKSLLKDGFTIGAHSLDHPKFSEIPIEEQVRQTEQSVGNLVKAFDIKTPLFSFPFTDDKVSKAYFERLRNNPVSPVLTFGTAGLKRDQIYTNLQRIPVELGHASAMDIIRMEYVYYVLKSFIGKNTLKRF
ncbi:polysaccharide deacetylase family protein [Saccharicrinis sp. FJH62]|uniref:polysaccharide deacetylase family protein n=1 Tax=Saccharicrinis sp. FJH62 TaxID=3344657 RepID=UPI0035D4CDCE